MNSTIIEAEAEDNRTPYQVATDYLTNPKEKLSSRVRRKFQRHRAKVSPYASEEKKDWEAKLKKQLSELPIQKLIRRRKQFARHLATHAYLLKKMDPSSRFYPPVEQRGLFWAKCLNCVINELVDRAQNALIPRRSSIPLKIQKRGLAIQRTEDTHNAVIE